MTELPLAVIEIASPSRQAEPALRPVSPNVFQFEDTCHVYLLRQGKDAIAIDFGAGDVLDELAGLGIERITDVLVTHHHRDQVQGLQRAVDRGIRVWVPLAEEDLFSSVGAHWQARALANNYNSRQDRFSLLEDVVVSGTLRDYDRCRFGDLTVEVIPTPGHTVGSISLLTEIDGTRMAFSGDLIAGPGKVWSLAATQWSYNGSEGVTASVASLVDLGERGIQLLLPSHGEVMANPDAAIDLLVERLERLLELRRDPHDIAQLRAQPYEQVSRHLLRNGTSHAISYVLISESGKALLIDYGYDFTRGLPAGTDRASRRPWLYTISALKKQFGVRSVEAVIPTHYHDDHVAGFNLLRSVEGTQVWAAESFAGVLEQPTDYDLPCLWYEPIPVDRRLPLGIPIAWQEYSLTLHEQPGHTRYAVAIETTVDGAHVLFIGDQMGHLDGLDLNYVYSSGFQIEDYVRSAELYRVIDPDLLLTGHWEPVAGGPRHFDELLMRGRALEAIHRQLLPMEEIDLEAHGMVAEVRPYRVQAEAGQAFQLEVALRNPTAIAQDVVAKLAAPTGWLVEPSEAGSHLPALARGSVTFRVIAPVGTAVRRARIGVDVRVSARRLGQVVEALIDIA